MKKIISILMTVFILVSLVGCRTNSTQNNNSTDQTTVTATTTGKYVYRNAETVEKAKAKQGELLQLIKQYNSK